jgi:hypothetical protein
VKGMDQDGDVLMALQAQAAVTDLVAPRIAVAPQSVAPSLNAHLTPVTLEVGSLSRALVHPMETLLASLDQSSEFVLFSAIFSLKEHAYH